MRSDELNKLSKGIMAAGYRVHSALGPGMLEHAYCVYLQQELRLDGLQVQAEVPVPVVYKGVKLEAIGYRMDLLVEGEIIIEVKALEAIAPVHLAQLVSYLKLADRRVGLLFNFNVESFKNGIYRRVNKFEAVQSLVP